MNKQLYRYYLVMALSFVVDSIISYYLPYNFDKLGITIVPCVSLMMFTFGKKYTKLATYTLLEMFIAVIVTIIAQEVVIYWLVWITNVTQLSIVAFLTNRLLPTLGANLLLIAPVYFIHKKLGFEGKVNAYQSKRS